MKRFLDVVETNSFDPSSWSTFLRTDAGQGHQNLDPGSRDRADENASQLLEELRDDSPEDLGLSMNHMEDANHRHNARHTMDLRVFPWYKELLYLAMEYVVVVAHTIGLGQDFYFEGVKYSPWG
ncbi:hypothetical protein ColKHC_00300 [Colletotrichum higginsianum]|nr:hypothetical protein ColKHC_00300 [Colletotrichum higginsianum]